MGGGPPAERGDDGVVPGGSQGSRHEIQGSVFGPAIQARDVFGGVHVHETQAAVPPPRQLPPPVDLSGREREFAAIDGARASRVVVITGPPGIGKSALAITWAQARREDFLAGQLFADLRGHAADGPASPSEVLGMFLRALGIGADAVPAELAELTALYRSVTSGRRLVVVLDDAIAAGQVTPLLPASADSVALITSRWRLASLVVHGARTLQLDRLEPDAALDLLARVLGDERVAAEPAATRELARLCAYFPLTLRIAAARLAVRPNWPVSEMAGALRQERRRLAALEVEEDMAMRAALDLSYRALPPAAARMYRLMGLLPGSLFDSHIAAAAATLPVATSRQLLEVLADANLLDDVAGGRYRFHDLIKLHARELAEQDEYRPESEEAIGRMLSWYLVTVTDAGQMVTPYRHDQPRDVRYRPAEPLLFPNAAAALDWLERELPDVAAAIRYSAEHGFPVVAWQLVDALWPLFARRGHYRERLELDRIGVAAARSCNDATGEAKMLNRLGLALIDSGELDEAAECFDQASVIWQATGNDYRLASSLRRLGLVDHARGRCVMALERFRQALATYQRLGEQRAVAKTLSDIGAALTDAGRPAEALPCLDQARELLASLPDPYNQARVLARLGRAQEQAGDRFVAAGTLDAALHAMRRAQSPPGEADVLQLLGQLAESQGQLREARDRYEEALAILTRLDAPGAAELRDHLQRLAPGD
jgi:tetratricopeptide (TPR) repeat protein